MTVLHEVWQTKETTKKQIACLFENRWKERQGEHASERK